MEIVNCIANFINNLLAYLLNNWISITALVISLITLKRNSVKLDVTIPTQARWGLAIILNTGESIVNEFGLLRVQVTIINSSNIDLGYFDLSILDENTGDFLNIYHQMQFTNMNELENREAISYLDTDGNSYGINLPNGTHGIIKAHSLTAIDIFVSPEKEVDKLFLMFKTTKRKSYFKKYKHGYFKSPYEQYYQSITVNNSSKPDYENILNSNDETE